MCELKIPIKIGFVMVYPGDFPGGSDGKASAYNVGDPGSIPGSGRSLGEGKPTPVFLPGESHGQRSLVGYSPWDHKELETSDFYINTIYT